jgi:hypothetical protein
MEVTRHAIVLDGNDAQCPQHIVGRGNAGVSMHGRLAQWVGDARIHANVPSVYGLGLQMKYGGYLQNQASAGGGWLATAFTTDDPHSSEAAYNGGAMWTRQ